MVLADLKQSGCQITMTPFREGVFDCDYGVVGGHDRGGRGDRNVADDDALFLVGYDQEVSQRYLAHLVHDSCSSALR